MREQRTVRYKFQAELLRHSAGRNLSHTGCGWLRTVAKASLAASTTVWRFTVQGKRSNKLTKQTRGRLGCLNCRRRRKKCDEFKPACSRCQSKAEHCEWDTGVRFRMYGLTAGRHDIVNGPSQAAHRDRPVMESLRSVSGDELQTSPFGAGQQGSWLLHEASPQTGRNEYQHSRNDLEIIHQATPYQVGLSSSPLSTFAELPQRAQRRGDSVFTEPQRGSLDHLNSRSDSCSIVNSCLSVDRGLPELRNAHHVQQVDTSSLDLSMAESPDMCATHYPNAVYRELHTTLHNSILETTRNTGFTRQCTQELSARQTPERDDSINEDEGRSTSLRPETKSARGRPPKLNISQRREKELWVNYLDEVAPWLDMFDNQRHFQHTLPIMAKSAAHLRLAMLALSARQIERKNTNNPYIESLDLYQEAIRLIVQDLHTMDTAVIASCVLLCVLEMMSSSPRDWGRHLDGCAILIQTAEINGVVGGMRQALFWCFARMDVWGGFMSENASKIPVNQWLEQGETMASTVSQFRASLDFDNYANYAVFLCASVLGVVTRIHATIGGKQDHRNSYLDEWKAMFDLLQDWYICRPEKMQPLLSYPAEIGDASRPFPIIVYGNASAINGNILYHASALLMLQSIPKDHKLGKMHRSVLWHARQICGISTSNDNHGAWINALQPLWIAGKVMSSPLEHRVILDVLLRIERETGWATSWRAENLKDYWGALD
ncbi:C6 zinc finger domain protein [Boeremia exigua]|uniref:C6 zinc finger domain protein n=1 Tax=Boeremia exigua TaxID=749465 RepID=UPI001E8CF596|nr:C6 zinc finger domain protein [Boeremia exigua]KAH6613011.1 C6 zinc finger domain protein [Boeremia exigua]